MKKYLYEALSIAPNSKLTRLSQTVYVLIFTSILAAGFYEAVSKIKDQNN